MKDILLILVGLGALAGGGELLVRAAVTLGLRAGLSSLVTGLTIVALGTSAPELAVSIDAALVGSPGIAIGNVVGSNFANIALVLAISAILLPIDIEPFVLRRDLPVMLLGFAAIAGTLLPDGRIGILEGLLLLSALLVYVVWVVRVSRRRQAGGINIDVAGDIAARESLPGVLARLAGGILLLSLGGHWLVEGAVHIAARLGVSEALIGMTVVAVGTSLPEITASVISILRGHGSMAVGNIVGSNIWNTFCVLGTAAAITPLPRGDVSVAMLGIMAAAGVVLWIFCATSRQINRLEGAALLAGYIGCQAWLFS
ncbi:MAG: calcium/sodium antiporter [Gammaproteobacteria bacterium]|nr:calcium/sodium antiporter [Gammaproteobacteria bacterium]